jgi:DNA recombination-dependent growth factor C
MEQIRQQELQKIADREAREEYETQEHKLKDDLINRLQPQLQILRDFSDFSREA